RYLHDPRAIAQIHKDKAAEVPSTMHPSDEPDFGAGVIPSQVTGEAGSKACRERICHVVLVSAPGAVSSSPDHTDLRRINRYTSTPVHTPRISAVTSQMSAERPGTKL